MKRDVLFESPTELTTGEGTAPPRSAKPSKVAAGMGAVRSTLAIVTEEPGLVRGTKTLLRANQDGGVDCPSCAWPDPKERSVFEFCENGAKALADETTRKKIGGEFFERHSVEELSRRSDYWLNKQGRLTEPLYLDQESVHYRPISWQQAFDLMAEKIQATDPDRLAFYTSGRASNEAAFLYGTLARLCGTNNLPDCSNMCHESSGSALGKTIGIGKGTVTLEDFEVTDLILVVGQNPGTNHPRMLSALEKAKNNGATIVSINPLAEAGLSHFKNPQDYLNPIKGLRTALGSGTALADDHLPVRVGGDLALFKGLQKVLLEWDEDGRNVIDHSFVEDSTLGFAELTDDLRAASWDDIEASCNLSKEQIVELAGLVAAKQRMIICWAMGVTQHENSVDTITQIVNLCLLRGSIGKAGSGLCPVRGHSNVQGDRTVGISHKPKSAFLEALAQEFSFEPPSEHGFDVSTTIEAMAEDKVDFFMSLGGNFLSATPDTKMVAEGLGKCALTVSVVTKLNRSHLVTGKEALILPCLGRTEIDLQASGPQWVSVENSMGKVHRSKGALQPASNELRSEVSIICQLGRRMDKASEIPWDDFEADYSLIRESIERVVPGFDEYNQRINKEGGFYLPNGPREGRFTTESGKAHFSVAPIQDFPLKEGEFRLMTIRSHDQFNTVVYGMADRYRGIQNSRRIVFINPEDLSERDLQAGQVVDIVSRYESGERRADSFTLVAYPIPHGCCAAYFPEANPVVPVELRDPVSGCPASKNIAVSLEPRV